MKVQQISIAVLAVCVVALIGVGAIVPVRYAAYHPYRMVGSSMAPTLYDGDRILVDQAYYSHHPLADGDLIIFHHGKGVLLKRVSALPGETIEGRDQKLIRNGIPVMEPYATYSKDHPLETIDTFSARKIGPEEVFVTGDSRDLSLDSRETEFQPVRPADVIGKVVYVYWSTHPRQRGHSF